MEIWKDIIEYEGLYQVSTLGRVKSVEKTRAYINRGKKRNFHRKERILKIANGRGGYKLITLSKNDNSKTFRVHRLVAQAFIPNPENKPQVNHIDEDKSNNSLNNLEWVSSYENMHWGSCLEKTHSKKNYKDEAIKRMVPVIAIKNNKEKFFDSIKSASEELGLYRSAISQCLSGKQHTTGGYSFRYAVDRNTIK
ncbi:NUMOD4 domain-containing protein [Leuconostoc suionicum]|uniref:NUMOD4 domain-containing protein n=1 Tax=Leuconostoc suionicum TaxID=1511761 RepID=UPI0028D371F8|nr:NUMOD4 domain-containing protein [Leuconostoc suionicum]